MIDIAHHPELTALARTSDGLLRTGAGDVVAIKAAADRKVEFVCFASGGVLAQVTSAMVIRPTTRCTPCGLRSPCGRC